jgi:4-hydroxy-tetrahydrodipicolinate synthase
MAMLNGSLVAIVTPMHDDGSLDLDAFRKLIDWHIQEGTDGIVVVGTTGESPTVDFDEHHLLIRTAVEHANRRISIVAGTGANSTREAIELAAYAKQAGADMSLSVVPYYNKPTQEGLYRHFQRHDAAAGADPEYRGLEGCDREYRARERPVTSTARRLCGLQW